MHSKILNLKSKILAVAQEEEEVKGFTDLPNENLRFAIYDFDCIARLGNWTIWAASFEQLLNLNNS